MNTQRWLALTVVGSIVAIIATRSLWSQSLQGDPGAEEQPAEEAVPTPFSQATPAPLSPTDAGPRPTLDLPAIGEESMDAMPEATPDFSGGPFILARGNFVQIDALHGGEGTATIYQAPDSTRFVRLDPFSVTDSPDLRVALAANPAPRMPADLTSSGFIDLGQLESNTGPQNIDIPLNVRLEQFESVVIYDKQFNIIFTTATLQR